MNGPSVNAEKPATPESVVTLVSQDEKSIPFAEHVGATPSLAKLTTGLPLTRDSLVGTLIVITGPTKSAVTEELLPMVAVTGVPTFPAMSVKLIENGSGPVCDSSPERVSDAVQLLPLVLSRAAVLPAIVAVGVWIVSSEVNEAVTTSLVFASVGVALLDAIETELRVGAVWSYTRAMVLETVLPFPAASVAPLALTVTETGPSTVGVIVNVYGPVPETALAEPLVTVTSDESKPVIGSLKVAVTENAAFVGVAELEVSATVGNVLSTVTVFEVSVTMFPALSVPVTSMV